MSISKEIDEIKFLLKSIPLFLRDFVFWKHQWSRLFLSLSLFITLHSICIFLRKKIFMFRNGKQSKRKSFYWSTDLIKLRFYLYRKDLIINTKIDNICILRTKQKVTIIRFCSFCFIFSKLKISYQLNFLYSNSSLVSLQVWSLFIQIICNFWSNHFFMCYLKIIFFSDYLHSEVSWWQSENLLSSLSSFITEFIQFYFEKIFTFFFAIENVDKWYVMQRYRKENTPVILFPKTKMVSWFLAHSARL